MRVWLNRPDDELNRGADSDLDMEALLHPAGAFSHPSAVVHDTDLTLNEKRAILASWASDACAVESAPALRARIPGGDVVTFDDVMDALRALDDVHYGRQRPHYRRVIASRIPGLFGRKSHGRSHKRGPSERIT
jgi:hypothetical protein